MTGGNLLGAAGEFAARQRLQHQRGDQPVAEQGDFFGFGIHRDDLLSQKHKADGPPAPGKSCVGPSGGRRRRAERGATPVGSEKRRPAQQVDSQIGKQEAVGGLHLIQLEER